MRKPGPAALISSSWSPVELVPCRASALTPPAVPGITNTLFWVTDSFFCVALTTRLRPTSAWPSSQASVLPSCTLTLTDRAKSPSSPLVTRVRVMLRSTVSDCISKSRPIVRSASCWTWTVASESITVTAKARPMKLPSAPVTSEKTLTMWSAVERSVASRSVMILALPIVTSALVIATPTPMPMGTSAIGWAKFSTLDSAVTVRSTALMAAPPSMVMSDVALATVTETATASPSATVAMVSKVEASAPPAPDCPKSLSL